MSAQMPEYPQSDTALIDVDRAHKALEKINSELVAACDAATDKIAQDFNPIIFAAQSVLYEKMGQAANVGFTYNQLREVMDCDGH